MTNKNNTFTVENTQYEVGFNGKVSQIMKEMELDKYTVIGSIISLGEKLNNMKDEEHFIVIDKLYRIGIVCVVDRITNGIDVMAVVRYGNIYIKDGMKVYGINEWSR